MFHNIQIIVDSGVDSYFFIFDVDMGFCPKTASSRGNTFK